MKNRKLNQLLVAGMISAAMMTSGISVQAADFSDDTSTVEEQSVGSAEEEAPEVEDGSEFQSDAAEASSAVALRRHWREIQVPGHFVRYWKSICWISCMRFRKMTA